jgi:tetratricopeptide (TPR) repeat protein
VKVRLVKGQEVWALVHPSCVLQRVDDLEEALEMIEAGELDLAQRELRWLLEGCGDMIDAHRLLGEIAMELGDIPLARGHFGYAYDLGRKALSGDATQGPLPYDQESNRGFLESAKGLAWCLQQIGRGDAAGEVLRNMLRWDPSDPLGASQMLEHAE